jgi:hypothetical protein
VLYKVDRTTLYTPGWPPLVLLIVAVVGAVVSRYKGERATLYTLLTFCLLLLKVRGEIVVSSSALSDRGVLPLSAVVWRIGSAHQ